MKKLLFIVLMLTSYASFAQPQFGGQVGGYDNSGTKKFWMFNGNSGKVWDSISNVTSAAMKLKMDSLYTKINSTIAVTLAGHDSTTDSRIGVKLIQNPTIANTSFAATQSGTWNINNISGTISLPTGAATSTNQSTHNTLLQGIKTIDSNINLAMGDVYSNLVSINGMVSELPAQTTSLSSIDSKLTDISGYTDQIEGGISTTNSTLSNSNALLQGIKTLDSTINNKLNDSIRVFATNGFGSGGGGGDSTTNSRIGVKLIQNPTITNTSFGISGSLPAFASTPTVNIGTTGTIPVSGTFWQATQPVSLSSVPSHAVTNAGTFAVQVDSSTQRQSFKIKELPSLATGSNAIGSITNTSFGISGTLPAFATTPTFNIGTGGYAVSASDSTKYRITHKISESALPTGAATESTLSTLNGKVPSGLTVNSNRLAIYAPDSIRVFATNGFGSGGGGGGTQYAELSTTSPATGTVALGRYMSTPPTLTNGQLYAPMLNSRGTILADVTSSVPNIASPASVPTSGYEVYGLVSTASPSPINNRNAQLSLTEKGGLRTTLVDLSGNYVDASGGGGGGGGGGATAVYDTVGSATSMTVTNLNSLANSATVGWQSDRIDNITSTKATDYRVFVKCTMANTVPGNDKQIYVYAAPFYYDGSTWQGASLGTTSQATGTQGSCTIASAAPNNLILLGVLSYSTQNMVLQSSFNLSNAFGRTLPDGFSIVLINFTGASVSASGNVVSYKPVYQTNR